MRFVVAKLRGSIRSLALIVSLLSPRGQLARRALLALLALPASRWVTFVFWQHLQVEQVETVMCLLSTQAKIELTSPDLVSQFPLHRVPLVRTERMVPTAKKGLLEQRLVAFVEVHVFAVEASKTWSHLLKICLFFWQGPAGKDGAPGVEVGALWLFFFVPIALFLCFEQ
jgi:hypothetical protein